jgi:hypothetical protein
LPSTKHKQFLFFSQFNSIYSKIGSVSPAVILSLLSAYSLPTLLYGIESIVLLNKDIQRCSLAYDRAFMKIFATYNNDVIRHCQFYSGHLPLANIIDLRKINFLTNLKTCVDADFCNIFSIEINDELIGLYNKYLESPINNALNLINYNIKQQMWLVFEKGIQS